MANLFRRFALGPQQVRFLPRFNQPWPEGQVPPSLTYPEEQKKRPQSVPPTPLVINAAKKAEKPRAKQPITEVCFTKDEQGNLVYTKMQNKDERINKIMSKVKGGKSNWMLLEGKRLIQEALEAGCRLEYILFSRLKEVEFLKPSLPQEGRLYKMPYSEMQIWSDLTTNPGIMGVFEVPRVSCFEPKSPLPITIICDNVREPSNLGAVLRVSSGVGCQQVLLTKGCTNLWMPKVLRSACGAHFKVKTSREPTWGDLRAKIPQGAQIFVADNNMEGPLPIVPYFSVNFRPSNHVVLVIGGETEGLSAEAYNLVRDFNGVRVNVPLSNGVDSLNTGTALGIIAFEIKRQLIGPTGMK